MSWTPPRRRVRGRGGRRLGWRSRSLLAARPEARRYDFLPLTQMQSWSGVPAGMNLFDSIVVFENYPIDDGAAAAHGLRLPGLGAGATANYPLSLPGVPGQGLDLELGYDPALLDPATL